MFAESLRHHYFHSVTGAVAREIDATGVVTAELEVTEIFPTMPTLPAFTVPTEIPPTMPTLPSITLQA